MVFYFAVTVMVGEIESAVIWQVDSNSSHNRCQAHDYDENIQNTVNLLQVDLGSMKKSIFVA